MNKYSNFSYKDFIEDDLFQEWVLNSKNSEFWINFLSNHPEKKEEIEQAKLVLTSLKFKEHSINEIKIDEIKRKIDKRTERNKRFKSLPNQVLKIAAAVSAIILIATLAILQFTPEDNIHYTTSYGETKTITLADGTTVILNGNSSIIVNKDLEKSEVREVWLQGEGFFRVTHNKSEFKVHTDKLDIMVLGTTFNVNARAKRTQVALTSGKVKVDLKNLKAKEASTLVMKPGDLVNLSENNKVTVAHVNPDHVSSWTKKMLIFNNTPLSEIAETLRNNYGVEVIFEDPDFKEVEITGEISTKSLNLIISSIAKSVGAEVEKDNNKVIFKK